MEKRYAGTLIDRLIEKTGDDLLFALWDKDVHPYLVLLEKEVRQAIDFGFTARALPYPNDYKDGVKLKKLIELQRAIDNVKLGMQPKVKTYKNEIEKALNEAMEPTRQAVKQLQDSFKQMRARMDAKYESVYTQISAWMAAHGHILPEKQEFYDWLISEGFDGNTPINKISTFDKNDFLRFSKWQEKRLKDFLSSGLEKEKSESTWREKAIAHEYKVKAGIEKQLTRTEQKAISKGFEKAFDSLNPRTKNTEKPYKEPTITELQHVVQLLREFPEAQKLALKELKQKESRP